MSNREALYAYQHPTYAAGRPGFLGLLSGLCLFAVAATVLATNLV